MAQPATRSLGRTRREVTTLGLGGQGSIQWPAAGTDPVAIIEKAWRRGINYMDTSNVYGPSQKHFGEAFYRLGISPSSPAYDSAARKRLFVATKTHIRTARRPHGERFRTDYSQGMKDGFGVSFATDDVRRSLSLMFGDGKGGYPEDAYLDSVQLHNINTKDEVDMLFEGMAHPSPNHPWMGAIPALLDLREGTNRTGCNPKKEKCIRHIGITGHWDTSALMYAIQRDTSRVIDTLLVSINPADHLYMPHRHNAIAAAVAAGMGIIGMKVFADAAYYHKRPHFSSSPQDVYHGIGSGDLPSHELIRYALSVGGIDTIIVGIGRIDTDPEKCQLMQNLHAAQIEMPLNVGEMERIEKLVESAGKTGGNAYFQRSGEGLSAPRNVGAEPDSSPSMGRTAVRISWDTAYAGAFPIARYDVLRDGERIGTVSHRPQYTPDRFCFDDVFGDDPGEASFSYMVKAIDTRGNEAGSREIIASPSVAPQQ
jgi:aryl-alcohol dehydrogenase-like predicted oxidoreductase